eukprot:1495726-Lingulodinium_polyedra.AAC.1
MEGRRHRMSAEKCQVLVLAPCGSKQYFEALAAIDAVGLPVAAGRVGAFGAVLGGLRAFILEADG